jgi:hypothetical protein
MDTKIVYEMEAQDLFKPSIVEASDNAPETIELGTGQTDISQYGVKAKLARSVISQSLPFMMGFVQPLKTPVGFVYGFKTRSQTSVPGITYPYSNQRSPAEARFEPLGTRTRRPADPMTDIDEDGLGGYTPAVPSQDAPPTDNDPVIIRKKVQTDVREVIFDITNETIQDIQSMFGEDFPKLLRNFLANNGEVYGMEMSDTDTLTASFFLPQMTSLAIKKVNTDFINWILTRYYNYGTVDIATVADQYKIFNAIGELREKLFVDSNKSGNVFVLTSPRIANYIASTIGMTSSNGAEVFESGKPKQTTRKYGFVGQYGDVDVYQANFSNDIIIMGYTGDNGPNTASIYYTPYKEYIIQGGDDYETGHSNVFFRIRDAWTTNPQDTYRGLVSTPEFDENDPALDNQSSYLVGCTVTFNESVIIP